MKLIDYSKIDHPKFEPKNPIVFQNSKTKYYEIEYDAVYEDGHVEKKTGFSSYNYDYIEEYLRDYFEIDNGEKGINGPDFTKFQKILASLLQWLEKI